MLQFTLMAQALYDSLLLQALLMLKQQPRELIWVIIRPATQMDICISNDSHFNNRMLILLGVILFSAERIHVSRFDAAWSDHMVKFNPMCSKMWCVRLQERSFPSASPGRHALLAISSFILSVAWTERMMAGTPTAMFDHEVSLWMKTML